ncbi:MAG: hypothetical protein ABEI75_04945 [Halobaculum sp.]
MIDANDSSRITATSTRVSCGTAVGVNFDERTLSSAERQKLETILRSDEYRTTPPYDESTEAVVEMLRTETKPTEPVIVKYEGACYEVTFNRVFDD